MSELNRRNFVVLSTATCAGLMCSSVLAHEGHDHDQEKSDEGKSRERIIDVGPLSKYTKDGVTDTWAKSHDLFVIRDGGRLYAPTSTCTHKKCTIRLRREELVCPCHGSRYTNMGVPTKGPATIALFRFAISVDARGHVIVDKTRQFEEKDWDTAGAYVALPS